MLYLYRIFIPFYFALIRFAARFRPDAKKWTEGRKELKNQLSQFAQKHKGKKTIWMHCASLGEYEQGRPVWEQLKKEYPEEIFCLSFFSPSGYDQCKQEDHADLLCYFPSDLREEVQFFLDAVQPKLALFVKYEFWYNCLEELQKRKIPILFFATHIHQSSYLRSRLAGTFHGVLKKCEQIFVQNEDSLEFLQSQHFSNVRILGDPRVDRVLEVKKQAKRDAILERFRVGKKLLIVGSSWPGDEDLVLSAMKHDSLQGSWKTVFFPHDLSAAHLQELLAKCSQPILYSECHQDQNIEADQLIVDRIGLLKFLYHYADAVHVGGGFGKGVHSILEPLVYEKRISFGPKYQKFNEAVYGVQKSFLFSIQTEQELIRCLLLNEDELEEIQMKIQKFILFNSGATQKICEYIGEKNLI
ncbi:MAG TPA: glycosyltransferase N-terminal domain-containing protein [Saprospiraceae bacterium]|nr:glycosyltransferase N-terminal domain-containing protein [Saprospiraceae bacterium]